eukprot:4412177-Pleurochrysis_carterae.AAC.3
MECSATGSDRRGTCRPGGSDASPSEVWASEVAAAVSGRQGKDNSLNGRHPQIVGAWGQPTAAKVHPDPSPRVYACLGVSGTRLDGKGAAPKREDAHYTRLFVDEQLIRGGVCVGRTRRPIEYVDGLVGGVIPKTDGAPAGDE